MSTHLRPYHLLLLLAFVALGSQILLLLGSATAKPVNQPAITFTPTAISTDTQVGNFTWMGRVGQVFATTYMDIASNGLPVIVWQHDATSWAIARCQEATCTNRTVSLIAPVKYLFGMQLDSQDRVVFAHWGENPPGFPGDLHLTSSISIARCQDIPCSTFTSVNVTNRAGGAVWVNPMSHMLNLLDGDRPLLVYQTTSYNQVYNRIEYALVYVRCETSDCSTFYDYVFKEFPYPDRAERLFVRLDSNQIPVINYVLWRGYGDFIRCESELSCYTPSFVPAYFAFNIGVNLDPLDRPFALVSLPRNDGNLVGLRWCEESTCTNNRYFIPLESNDLVGEVRITQGDLLVSAAGEVLTSYDLSLAPQNRPEKYLIFQRCAEMQCTRRILTVLTNQIDQYGAFGRMAADNNRLYILYFENMPPSMGLNPNPAGALMLYSENLTNFVTPTPTASQTSGPTVIGFSTSTSTPTTTSTNTPPGNTPTPSITLSPSITLIPSITLTPSATHTPRSAWTPTPTFTASSTATITITPSITLSSPPEAFPQRNRFGINRVYLSWSPLDTSVIGYHIVIARDSNMTDIVYVDYNNPIPERFVVLDEGIYYWRVRGFFEGGAVTSWSNIESFAVLLDTPTPTVTLTPSSTPPS